MSKERAPRRITKRDRQRLEKRARQEELKEQQSRAELDIRVRELANLIRFTAEKHGIPYRNQRTEEYVGENHQITDLGTQHVGRNFIVETYLEHTLVYAAATMNLYTSVLGMSEIVNRHVRVTFGGKTVFHEITEHNGLPITDPINSKVERELTYKPGRWEGLVEELVTLPRGYDRKTIARRA